MATEEGEEAFFTLFLVFGRDEAFGFGEELGSQLALCFDQTFHHRAELLEELLLSLGHGTGDNQRRTGIVDQHRVDLIDDGIVMLALHEVTRTVCHVVAQVVETELVVRTEGDVCHVCLAAGVGVGLMLVDTVHTQTVELIERSHPLGVTLGQIVVDRHHVYTVSGQGIEEHRKGSHQGLTFTGSHLGNLAFVQHDTTEELYVIVHHVPRDFGTSRHPVVLIDCLVALDADKVFCGSQFTVEVGCRHLDFSILGKAACRILHDGESLRQDFVERLLIAVEHLLLQLVNLGEKPFTLFQLGLLDLGLQLIDFLTQVGGRVLDELLQFLCLRTQLVVAQLVDVRIGCFHLLHPRHDFLHVASSLVTKQLTQKFIKSHYRIVFIICLCEYRISVLTRRPPTACKVN